MQIRKMQLRSSAQVILLSSLLQILQPDVLIRHLQLRYKIHYLPLLLRVHQISYVMQPAQPFFLTGQAAILLRELLTSGLPIIHLQSLLIQLH